MAETRQNLLVGLFVVVGLGIVGVLAVLFGTGYTTLLGGDGYTLKIRFESAEGITEGNVVNVGGVQVGRVQHVDFVDPARFDSGVVVQVWIDQRYRIPADSRAETTEPGLGLGRPPIDIIPGTSSAEVSPEQYIPGEVKASLEKIVPRTIVQTLETTARQIGSAAEALTPVLDDLHDVMVKRTTRDVDQGGMQGNLSSAMSRFDTMLKHVNDVLGSDEAGNLRQALADIADSTKEMKGAVEDFAATAEQLKILTGDAKRIFTKFEQLVDTTQTEVHDVGQTAQTMLETGTRLLDSLYEIARVIESGEGTLGKLVHDNEAYEALVLTTKRLADTIEEIRVLVIEWQKGKIRVSF